MYSQRCHLPIKVYQHIDIIVTQWITHGSLVTILNSSRGMPDSLMAAPSVPSVPAWNLRNLSIKSEVKRADHRFARYQRCDIQPEFGSMWFIYPELRLIHLDRTQEPALRISDVFWCKACSATEGWKGRNDDEWLCKRNQKGLHTDALKFCTCT